MFDFLTLFITFSFGTIFGSFVNVLITRSSPSRLHRDGEFVFGGRSHCDRCEKTLGWYELIPLISYAFLRGRCSRCKSKILFRYFVVEFCFGLLFAGGAYVIMYPIELADFRSVFQTFSVLKDSSGVLFSALSFNSWQFILNGAFLFLGLFCLGAIFFFDLEYYFIPDIFTVGFAVAGIGEAALRFMNISGMSVWYLIFAMAAVFFVFFLLWYSTDGKGMGFGDVKLAPIIPLFLGPLTGIFAIVFAFWIGALVSLVLMVVGRKKMKDQIPFGPFLVLGTLLVLLYPHILTYIL